MRVEKEPTSRHAVASYRTYAEAERAVDSLADQGFPVERLSIRPVTSSTRWRS